MRPRKAKIPVARNDGRYWRDDEHELFLEALLIYKHTDTLSISAYINRRLSNNRRKKSPIQIRTHSIRWIARVKAGKEELPLQLEDLELFLPKEPGVIREKKAGPRYRSPFCCTETIDWESIEDSLSCVEETEEPIPCTPECEEYECLLPTDLWIEEMQLPAVVPGSFADSVHY